jgi:hypothetical protein
MGSGLILLVIVGAWLAVLVPMGLRAHDSASTSRAGERWGDAMRVLSRRSPAAPLDDEHPAAEAVDDDPDVDDGHHVDGGSRRVAGLRRRWPAGTLLSRPSTLLHRARASLADRPPVGPAGRRRRVLLALLLVAVLTVLVARLGGPVWLYDVAGALTVLALLFLVACRRSVVRRASLARQREYAEADRQALLRRRETEVEYVRVLPPPVQQPVDVPIHEPVPAPARPAAGGEWQPVPVPLPTYVGKATAPRRGAQVLEPETWAAPPAADDEQGVFEPRRVVGGW